MRENVCYKSQLERIESGFKEIESVESRFKEIESVESGFKEIESVGSGFKEIESVEFGSDNSWTRWDLVAAQSPSVR
jgi:hypothetical protein